MLLFGWFFLFLLDLFYLVLYIARLYKTVCHVQKNYFITFILSINIYLVYSYRKYFFIPFYTVNIWPFDTNVKQSEKAKRHIWEVYHSTTLCILKVNFGLFIFCITEKYKSYFQDILKRKFSCTESINYESLINIKIVYIGDRLFNYEFQSKTKILGLNQNIKI